MSNNLFLQEKLLHTVRVFGMLLLIFLKIQASQIKVSPPPMSVVPLNVPDERFAIAKWTAVQLYDFQHFCAGNLLNCAKADILPRPPWQCRNV